MSLKHDLDLGETLVVENEIKLEPNSQPFCEKYDLIPPSMYEEVRQNLQEILEVHAIRPSWSPWASAVDLVSKMDGKLQFCIHLCRLNNMTIKDAYSLPQIQDILECLRGAI